MNRAMRNIKSYAEKPQSKGMRIAVLKRLWGYMMQHKLLVAGALLIMLISNLASLAAPLFSGKAINAIKPGVSAVDFDTVLRYCALMAICYVASAILSYTLAAVMTILSKKIVYTMRRQVFDR
ncbi:MAG: ABC transporter ATP-binding protein, partial [Clostridia bacterium]|nr:ABC transporter ATP-binding protein [Clostridia bacterium]